MELAARMPGARDRARRALGIPAGATVIGAVGRLSYQKAPEDFLSTIGHLGRADVVGVWVGGGELAEHISRLARAQPAGRIVLVGERADVPEILPAFDIFVLPSLYEGLPTAVVEAMVCGIPVVATAVNAVPMLWFPARLGSWCLRSARTLWRTLCAICLTGRPLPRGWQIPPVPGLANGLGGRRYATR